MNARLRKLLEDRAAAWSEVQDIQARRAAAGYDPTAEDGEAFTRALDDVERLSKDIEAEERAERMRVSYGFDTLAAGQDDTNPASGGSADESRAAYRSAFVSYLRRGMGRLGEAEQRMLEQGFVTGDEYRALGASVDAAGGYTVPTEFLTKLVDAIVSFGGLMSVAEVLTTTSGAPMTWSTGDDTGNKGAILGENTAAAEQDLVFGEGTLGAYMYTSKLVRISIQLIQDSGIDVEGHVARKLGERIGRAFAEHAAVGTGTAQPQGITVGLTKNVTSAVAAKVGYDDLVDVEHAIDPAYRQNARYLLHDTAVREIRKIKDSQNRPLWVPAMAGGVPSTINGQPYTVDNSLPTFAASSKSIVFGDIRQAYVVRVVRGAQLMHT